MSRNYNPPFPVAITWFPVTILHVLCAPHRHDSHDYTTCHVMHSSTTSRQETSNMQHGSSFRHGLQLHTNNLHIYLETRPQLPGLHENPVNAQRLRRAWLDSSAPPVTAPTTILLECLWNFKQNITFQKV